MGQTLNAFNSFHIFSTRSACAGSQVWGQHECPPTPWRFISGSVLLGPADVAPGHPEVRGVSSDVGLFVQRDDDCDYEPARPTSGFVSRLNAFALGAMALCTLASALGAPMLAGYGVLFAGVLALATSLGAVFKQNFHAPTFSVLTRRLELDRQAAATTDYRDSANVRELRIDGRTYAKSAVREVVLGHADLGVFGVVDDHWPVYLVLEDQVVRVGLFRDEGAALRMRRELAELFEIPVRERDDAGGLCAHQSERVSPRHSHAALRDRSRRGCGPRRF